MSNRGLDQLLLSAAKSCRLYREGIKEDWPQSRLDEHPWRNEGKKTLMEGSGVREERITFGLFPEHELLL